MGWWIADENGQILEMNLRKQGMVVTKKYLDDLPDKYLNGDGPADILGDALEAVVGEYVEDFDRPPSLEELDRAWRFVTGPYRRGQRKISDLVKQIKRKRKTNKKPKAEKRR